MNFWPLVLSLPYMPFISDTRQEKLRDGKIMTWKQVTYSWWRDVDEPFYWPTTDETQTHHLKACTQPWRLWCSFEPRPGPSCVAKVRGRQPHPSVLPLRGLGGGAWRQSLHFCSEFSRTARSKTLEGFYFLISCHCDVRILVALCAFLYVEWPQSWIFWLSNTLCWR